MPLAEGSIVYRHTGQATLGKLKTHSVITSRRMSVINKTDLLFPCNFYICIFVNIIVEMLLRHFWPYGYFKPVLVVHWCHAEPRETIRIVLIDMC